MKNLIRKEIKNKLILLDFEKAQTNSSLIQNNLFKLDIFQKAKNIGIYHSRGDEVSTIEIIKNLLENKAAFLPKIRNTELEFIEIKTLDDLEIGPFNIFEPKNTNHSINPSELDLLIVPCIAIDEEGNRIGRGKGFFDRFLSKYKNLQTICLAYEYQVLPKIKAEIHDQKINYIITETRIIKTPTASIHKKILDGKQHANKIILELKEKVRKDNIKASLAVILVGSNPASESYVKIKLKKCQDTGIKVQLLKFDISTTEEKIKDTIKKLNKDSNTTGILVQLPLPNHINVQQVLDTVTPHKDVDGLSSISEKKLISGQPFLSCCTPKGILRLLEENNITLHNKKIVLIGHGRLVGKPLALMLKQKNIPITICDKKTCNLEKEAPYADILISATGIPNLIKKQHIKNGAIIIDAGTAKFNNKVVGDVNFEEVLKIASLITPVPGGVGPMTVAMLIENIIESYKIQKKS